MLANLDLLLCRQARLEPWQVYRRADSVTKYTMHCETKEKQSKIESGHIKSSTVVSNAHEQPRDTRNLHGGGCRIVSSKVKRLELMHNGNLVVLSQGSIRLSELVNGNGANVRMTFG